LYNSRHNPLSLKALAAKHRTPLRRLKRHGCFQAAIRTGGACFRPHRSSPGGALRLAKLASLGIISELLVVKEKLLTCGEYELIPAIHTLENLIDELHNPRSPAALQSYRSNSTEPPYSR